MKIAHVCPFYTPAIGGVKQVVEELAKRQLAAGNEVHIFTSDWDKERRVKKKEEIIDGIYVHRCKHIFRIANFATIWPSVFLRLLNEDFDIIHSHVFGHVHFVLAAFASKIKGIPHIHTTHCPWTDAFRSLPGKLGILISYNIISRIALKFTDKIIAITPWEINFIKKYSSTKDQIVVIPNGMGEIFFIKIKNNDFKKKLNIKNKLVLFFGRLNITKGPEKFVEIAHSILKERKDVTFVIRGPDEGMREIVRKKIGNEKRIILLPETRDRKEIIKMYQAADVFVLPSYREGLPLTLFEAMASGNPIVASPVNGVPYEMKQPENGFLVKYGDNQGFKKRVIELLDNKKLRDRISKDNIKRSKAYRWDIISKKTIELYKDILKGNR
ncbi:MAG: glycosyltransferase family 4 protein [Nanoarchaeota archaeon]|nr:glycosyltransferase family 4 protein [Nanoarchaeota archaeon]